MIDRQLLANLLAQAGRLLLEYNESSGAILRTLRETSRALTGDPCHVTIAYHGVAVSLAGEEPPASAVNEFRNNAAAQIGIHQILDKVRQRTLDASSALTGLGQIEADTPHYPLWIVALLLGSTAASFSQLLGADGEAALVVALASSLGFVARRVMGHWHVGILALPLTAAFIGAVFGGLAIRQGWTRSPELVLVVPSLMVVPGPHLINGIVDLLDNQVPMSLFRMTLAAAILLAGAVGIVLGVEMTLPAMDTFEQSVGAAHLNLASDMALAGIATCGFAVFYNVPRQHLWRVAAGGMAGHGLRFLALEANVRLASATFLGGLAIGVISAWIARQNRSPVAVIAFAGAVTMIPGLSLFRALAGVRLVAFFASETDPEIIARTLGHALQAFLVVGGLGLGLIVGARVMLALAGERSYVS